MVRDSNVTFRNQRNTAALRFSGTLICKFQPVWPKEAYVLLCINVFLWISEQRAIV